MNWSPDPQSLRGRVAAVTGATRGAGRGIALALGEAGATVICTGRSTRALGSSRSDYDRPETIEETAELVTRLGGNGIAIAVDHLNPGEVKHLADRIGDAHGHIDILVNDIWGAEVLKGGPAEWNTPVWKHDLDKGLRILYRLSVFYDLAKISVNRLAFSQRHELKPHGATAVSITPGWLRSEMMPENFDVSEERWRDALAPTASRRAPVGFAVSESPRYIGRAVAALAADPNRQRWNQRSVTSGQLAMTYGFTDIDGSRPDVWKYTEDVEAGRHADPENYR
jgi:NAD(P)-dependent dehydrogenase (short-subunit alcohol dehydrogenase family)